MYRTFALVWLVACTPTTFAFTPNVSGFTAKSDHCPVEVMTSPPSRGYQELGTLELYNGDEPKTLSAFKSAVHKQVCRVGGDAAIAVADAHGAFTTGSIIAYTDSGAPVPNAPPAQQSDNELPK